MSSSSRKRRRRSSTLISSAIVYMASSNVDAYTVSPPSAKSHQNYKRRLRTTHTRLNSSAAAVNGLAAQEQQHSHSNALFNVGYDAEHIIKFYDQRPWEVGLRLNMLGLPLLGKKKNIFACNG